MYELLLQAEKALADGLLVQAEQTYWQLIELDSANAIALAGLAQISLERGDERLARRFADRAMAIDPENVVAGRVVDALEHKDTEDEAKAPDLPLAAARRLESLSKRRATSTEPADGEGASAETAANGSKTKHRNRHKAGREDATPLPAHRDATRHEPHHAMPPGKRRFGASELRTPTPDAYAAAEAAAAVEAVDALDVVDEPPTEVPSRISGEADDPGAIDAIGAGESVAMRLASIRDGTDFDEAWLQDAEEIEARGIEAEKVAAKEAKEAEEAEEPETAAREAATDGSAAISVEPQTAATETATDGGAAIGVESVADTTEREAAELEAAWAREAQARWVLHVAAANSVVESEAAVEPEAAVESEAAVEPAPAVEASPAVETDAVLDTSVLEWQADEPAEGEPAPAGSIDQEPQVAEPGADELEAAEAEAARLAPRELLESQSVDSGDLVEREGLSPQPFADDAEELSEKEAETQALREALAIVLGNEGQTGSIEPWNAPDLAPPSATPAVQQTAAPVERSDESATQGELAGPPESADPPETGGSDEPIPETGSETAPRRRKGLFHRFGGS